MQSLRRLLMPLAYLRIQRQDKNFDELWLPGILTVLTVFLLALSNGKIPVFGSTGAIASVVSYLQILSGFYIASLAAIATFNKESMDKPMPGIPPKLKIRGRVKPENLSRRRFLCFMFGYLSFVSLILYFAGSGINLSASAAKDILPTEMAPFIKWPLVAAYTFATYNMLITTLLGLYYMTDRIHKEEPRFVDSPSQTSTAPAESDTD
ncbi:hypothetical protein [Pseudomonas sp. RIT411]|uniref:hypothetical protein n=1 Tax=Pseudomonas sp. RIT411 TaxID=2202160 RepID=UPI0011BE5D20|nr:hypothetical protein [Pseudomonas sp. RIT 411]